MKKNVALLAILLVTTITVTACNRSKNDDSNNKSLQIPETGKVIDITDKNNRLIFVEPGDVIQVTLVGRNEPGFQWSIRQPVTGGYLSLKHHDNETTNEQITSDWLLKVEKDGEFNIYYEFDHPILSEVPEETFRAKIISGSPRPEIDKLIVDSPISDEIVEFPLTLEGFANLSEEKIGYILKDDSGKIIIEGTVDNSESSSEWTYFSKEVIVQKPAFERGFLEIFIQPEGGEDPTETETIQLKF